MLLDFLLLMIQFYLVACELEIPMLPLGRRYYLSYETILIGLIPNFPLFIYVVLHYRTNIIHWSFNWFIFGICIKYMSQEVKKKTSAVLKWNRNTLWQNNSLTAVYHDFISIYYGNEKTQITQAVCLVFYIVL